MGLALNGQDTLHLGTALGLYCLINIGDNNADDKEEIAFVIDYLDFSRINSCKIYSFCNSKWTLLKQFGIHEDSFDLISDTVSTFDCIKEHLEKRNGVWVYQDNWQDDYDTSSEVRNMKPLDIDGCD